MILYNVVEYLEIDRWFTTKHEAYRYFEDVFHDRAQEKSELLQVRRCKTSLTPAQVVIATLNGVGWVEEFFTIRKANPQR